jgi:hypothetical protein
MPLRLALIALAGFLAFVPLPALEVERWFSDRLFPVLQSALTAVSNLVPFALLDVFILVVLAWCVWSLSRDVSSRRRGMIGGWAAVVGRVLVRTLTLLAVLYLGFMAAWGMNYRRTPLADRFAASSERPTPERARRLALESVNELNRLFEPAHAALTSSLTTTGPLAEAFSKTQFMVGIRRPARPAVPKRTFLDVYFRSAGVAGMTDPYFLETLVASDLLPVERPLVVAHEWSHLAGFADEGEANFLGWLTCVRGAPVDQYSGWLFLYGEVVAGLPRPMRGEVAARLDEGPRNDLRAIAERLQRNVRPRIASAGWQVYDKYLKANRVQAGAASYREVVRLALNVRFGSNWQPVLK